MIGSCAFNADIKDFSLTQNLSKIDILQIFGETNLMLYKLYWNDQEKHCSNFNNFFTVSRKSAATSHGALLAGRLVFSLGTRYLIISPCRCSGRGQPSVTVALLLMSASTYGIKKPLPNVPFATNQTITLSLSLSLLALVSADTLSDPNEPEPSPSDIMWILYKLCRLNYPQTTFV